MVFFAHGREPSVGLMNEADMRLVIPGSIEGNHPECRCILTLRITGEERQHKEGSRYYRFEFHTYHTPSSYRIPSYIPYPFRRKEESHHIANSPITRTAAHYQCICPGTPDLHLDIISASKKIDLAHDPIQHPGQFPASPQNRNFFR